MFLQQTVIYSPTNCYLISIDLTNTLKGVYLWFFWSSDKITNVKLELYYIITKRNCTIVKTLNFWIRSRISIVYLISFGSAIIRLFANQKTLLNNNYERYWMNTFMQWYDQYSKHGRKITNNKMRFKYNRIKK